MELLLGIGAIFGSVLFLGGACLIHGYKRGYREGKECADRYWLFLESEVDQERVKIWHEEGNE